MTYWVIVSTLRQKEFRQPDQTSQPSPLGVTNLLHMLHSIHILHNFVQFCTFCTTLHVLHTFVHFIQLSKLFTILHTLHILHNFAIFCFCSTSASSIFLSLSEYIFGEKVVQMVDEQKAAGAGLHSRLHKKMSAAKLFERGEREDRFCCTFAFESCSKAGLLFHHHNIVKPSMSKRIL